MMSLPVALVVTQWVVLFALGLLVLVMYRQLAHLLQLSGSAHDAGGPDPGANASAFEYRRLGEPLTHEFTPGRQPTVLLFSDPRCGACDTALAAVEVVTRNSRAASLRVLVVTDADDVAVAANSGLSDTALEVALVESNVVSRDYRVTGTPLLIGVDSQGIVRGKVSGPDEAAVRRFIRDFPRVAERDGGAKGATESTLETEKEVNVK